MIRDFASMLSKKPLWKNLNDLGSGFLHAATKTEFTSRQGVLHTVALIFDQGAFRLFCAPLLVLLEIYL
jgi:hypothetical protein